MNFIRGNRVIVTVQPDEKEDAYTETSSAIFVPSTNEDKREILRQGIVKMHGGAVTDLLVGQAVYVKLMQGERLSPTSNDFLFREEAIIGND